MKQKMRLLFNWQPRFTIYVFIWRVLNDKTKNMKKINEKWKKKKKKKKKQHERSVYQIWIIICSYIVQLKKIKYLRFMRVEYVNWHWEEKK